VASPDDGARKAFIAASPPQAALLQAVQLWILAQMQLAGKNRTHVFGDAPSCAAYLKRERAVSYKPRYVSFHPTLCLANGYMRAFNMRCNQNAMEASNDAERRFRRCSQGYSLRGETLDRSANQHSTVLFGEEGEYSWASWTEKWR
jgi:hypothetical protein